MTVSLNRVQLIGNLGADPKTITSKDGQSFVTATLATNELFKQNSELKNRVEWHQLIFFGNQIKVTEYLHKGSLIFIEGTLRSSQWTDKDGNNRQSISIVVSNIQFLRSGKSNDDKSQTNIAESHMTLMREMLQDTTKDLAI